MKKVQILAVIVFLLLTNLSSAQDPHFSQFYSNPLYLNPALSGTAQQVRVNAVHRIQWLQTIPYTTSSFSLDSPLGEGNSGLGFQVIRDIDANGVINTTIINGNFSHRINITKDSQIGFGIKMGAYQKTLNLEDLVFEDQLNDNYELSNPTKESFNDNNLLNGDISLGVLYFSDKLIAGVNASHINRPYEDLLKNSDNRIPIKYTFHLGTFIPIGDFRTGEKMISPNIIYEKQGQFQYLNLGMYYSSENLMLGTWYRIDDAVISSVGINIGDIRAGYSYDISIGQNSSNGNSHEFSLTYMFKLPKSQKIKNRYKGQCPSFQKHLF